MIFSMQCEWCGDQRDTDIASGVLQLFCLRAALMGTYPERKVCQACPSFTTMYKYGIGSSGHRPNYSHIDSTFLPELSSSLFDRLSSAVSSWSVSVGNLVFSHESCSGVNGETIFTVIV